MHSLGLFFSLLLRKSTVRFLYGIARFKRCAGMSRIVVNNNSAENGDGKSLFDCFFLIRIYSMYRFVATPNPNQLPLTANALIFTLSTVHFNRTSTLLQSSLCRPPCLSIVIRALNGFTSFIHSPIFLLFLIFP